MQLSRADGVVTMRLTDDRVFAGLALADQVLEALEPGDRTVVIDLALVAAVHSPLLANLVTVHVRLAQGGRLLELQGVGGQSRQILHITRLDTVIPVRG
jgi:anti-anti-sigma regulatory factor